MSFAKLPPTPGVVCTLKLKNRGMSLIFQNPLNPMAPLAFLCLCIVVSSAAVAC